MAGKYSLDRAQLSVLVPATLRAHIDRIARDNRVSIGYVVRECIAAGIDKVDARYDRVKRSPESE